MVNAATTRYEPQPEAPDLGASVQLETSESLVATAASAHDRSRQHCLPRALLGRCVQDCRQWEDLTHGRFSQRT